MKKTAFSLLAFALLALAPASLDAAKKASRTPAPQFPATELGRAASLERTAFAGRLGTAQLGEVAAGLASPDIFVRALAHAAAAQYVGQANNETHMRITAATAAAPTAPAWLRAYAATNREDLIAYDWIRHLAVEGKLFSASALHAEILLCADRAKRMGLGVELGDILKKTDAANSAATTDATAATAALRALWLETRSRLRPAILAASGAGDSILLSTRPGFHHKPNVCGVNVAWAYKPGGDILVLSLKTGEAAPLLRGRLGPGHVHGLDLDYDASRLVFAYAPQPVWPPNPKFETVWPRPQNSNACFARELRDLDKTEPIHLYELDFAAGEIIRLTDHNYWNDTEPAYLPSGGVVFSSDRSANSPSCDSSNNDLADVNLYTLSPDRATIRRLLNHKDIDMHPRVLNNGLVAYLRWEYQERNFMETHAVWTTRPDGSFADALFKQHLPRPYSVRLAGPLGESGDKMLAIATGHHAIPQGPLVILNPTAGGNNPAGVEVVTQGMRINEGNIPGRTVAEGGRVEAGGFYTAPFAFSEKFFLASYAFDSIKARRYTYDRADVDSNGYGLYLVDVYGNKELLHRDPWMGTYDARPLRPRKRPPVLPETADRSKNYAVCSIPDVRQGLEGVPAGAIRYIRIAEALPWPVVPGEGVKRWIADSRRNQGGWTNQEATRWCPVRIIGEVPVEADGSAHFKVPVSDNASVYFQALDENRMEIRRMRSSVSFAPGENRSCNGCHETNPTVPAAHGNRRLALSRPPSVPVPPPWGADVPIHFPRDVQPVLTKNCVSCHSGAKAKAGLDFSEGRAYGTIRSKKLVVTSNCGMDGGVTRVKQFGSHVSRLTQAVLKHQKNKTTQLTSAEWQALALWVDANVPHTGQMWAKLTPDGRRNVWGDYQWPAVWGLPRELPARGVKIAFTAPDQEKKLAAKD
jgi:hypothetical protein